MSKKIFLGSSILYKRPLPKFNSSYNSQIPNSTSNKQTISFNFEDDQFQNNKLISSVRSNILKINEDDIYQKIKNSKRGMNNPKCLSTRLSVNNITNNKLKKTINNGEDKNSLYFKIKIHYISKKKTMIVKYFKIIIIIPAIYHLINIFIILIIIIIHLRMKICKT